MLRPEVDNLMTPRFEKQMHISREKLSRTQLNNKEDIGTAINLLMIDFEKEIEMEINGNSLEPLAEGEAYVSSTLAQVLGIEAGGTFHLTFIEDDFTTALRYLAE